MGDEAGFVMRPRATRRLSHFRERARQRFGLELSVEECLRINERALNGELPLVHVSRNSGSKTYRVTLGEHRVDVVLRDGTLVTCLLPKTPDSILRTGKTRKLVKAARKQRQRNQKNQKKERRRKRRR